MMAVLTPAVSMYFEAYMEANERDWIASNHRPQAGVYLAPMVGTTRSVGDACEQVNTRTIAFALHPINGLGLSFLSFLHPSEGLL